MALAVSLAAGVGALAQSVPFQLQAAIISRMLGYDRALKARAGSSLGIGIVFNPADRESVEAHDAMLKAFQGIDPPTIQGLSVSVSSHPYKDAAGLSSWVAKDGIDALYVTPGLGEELEAIRAVCRERRVVSVSAVRDFVEKGIAVGVVVKGTKPKILVNLGAAEAVGMELDSKLLQLSEVIR